MTRIYIDFDDVICRTAEIILELANQKFGIDCAFDDITDFNLQTSFNLSDQQFKNLIDLIHEPEVLGDMRPVDGAISAMTELKKRGCELAIMTGRPPSTRASSLAWLKHYGVPYDSIAFVDKYARFLYNEHDEGGVTLDELKQMSFDIAIEDSASMACFLAVEMNVPVFLHDRPWNRSLAPHPKIQRCRDWME